MPSSQIIGVSAALGSALAWAVCALLFRDIGEKVSPLGMNLVKCTLGVILIGVLLLLGGFHPIDARSFFYLGLSGLLGIAIGDTFFFKALVRLGPRQTLLVETLGPVVTVLLALVFLGERPSLLVWSGMLLTFAGVTWVLWQHVPRTRAPGHLSGIVYGVLFVVANAVGIILAKVGIESISALQATAIRFLWAMAGLWLWGIMTRQIVDWMRPFKARSVARSIVLAVCIAIFGGFWLSLAALKYIDVSTATTLSLTTPVFILPLSAVFLKEKLSFASVAGAMLAVVGVILICK